MKNEPRQELDNTQFLPRFIFLQLFQPCVKLLRRDLKPMASAVKAQAGFSGNSLCIPSTPLFWEIQIGAKIDDLYHFKEQNLKVTRFSIPNAVWDYKFKPIEFMILSYLCSHSHSDNSAIISTEAVAKATHLTAATVEKYLSSLVGKGLIANEYVPTFQCIDSKKFFTLPNEIFLLNLSLSAFMVYAYGREALWVLYGFLSNYPKPHASLLLFMPLDPIQDPIIFG